MTSHIRLSFWDSQDEDESECLWSGWDVVNDDLSWSLNKYNKSGTHTMTLAERAVVCIRNDSDHPMSCGAIIVLPQSSIQLVLVEGSYEWLLHVSEKQKFRIATCEGV